MFNALLFSSEIVILWQYNDLLLNNRLGTLLFWKENAYFILHECPVRLCILYVPGALGDQNRVLLPEELKLQMDRSLFVGAGNWTGVICKSSKYFQPLSLLSRPRESLCVVD